MKPSRPVQRLKTRLPWHTYWLSLAQTTSIEDSGFKIRLVYSKLNQVLISLWRQKMEGLVGSLIVGGIAGWLAGQIMKGKGQGVLLNIIIGIIGGVIGGWLFGLFGAGLDAGIIGSLITATIGAVILLWIVGKVKN
jgi:uncharacterized membrane protein YeaQ/YmgE (transglycosylase-associated protein family)